MYPFMSDVIGFCGRSATPGGATESNGAKPGSRESNESMHRSPTSAGQNGAAISRNSTASAARRHGPVAGVGSVPVTRGWYLPALAPQGARPIAENAPRSLRDALRDGGTPLLVLLGVGFVL